MLGDQFAVAGDDLDRDAAVRERGQRGAGALLGRIEKGGKAGEHQFRFVADDGMRMVQRHFAPGDAQHAEAFLFERDDTGRVCAASAASSSGTLQSLRRPLRNACTARRSRRARP